jgi:HK97 family phage major capsid protein/HK97 family phage prohead protease
MSHLQRAYSLLDVKSVNEDERIIAGTASTPETDRDGDIMEPTGADFQLPIPLLWQHDADQPIGEVFAATVTAKGIQIKARIFKSDEPGALKDRLDLAWQSVKLRLVKGLSVGFKGIEYAFMEKGVHFVKWLWLELSCVTIPANQSASIATIKSLDRPAASGTASTSGTSITPGVSGTSRGEPPRTRNAMKKSISEQIKDIEARIAGKTEDLEAVQQKALDEGRSKDEQEKEQFKTLTSDISTAREELKDLRELEEIQKSQLKAVSGGDPARGTQSRGGQVIVMEKKLPAGIGMARYAMCIAKAKGSVSDAVAYAKQFYPDSGLDKAILAKAAVGAGVASGSSHWAEDLVPYNILQNDFIEYLRAGNIVDKFGSANPGGGPNYPSLRGVPFNVRVSGFSAGLTGNWVGEGKPAPASKATSINTTLTWAKVEALTALTQEEVRFSNPSAEQKVRDDIARAINYRIDYDFIDPAKAAVSNVSPASITNAVVATAPTTTTPAALITDLTTMMKLFGSNNLDTSDVVLIMSAQMAVTISMMTTTLGMPYFPNITMYGGNLRGIPVLVSENLTAVGSPGTQTIVAVKASEVYKADDGNVTIDASDQASIEMLDGSLTQDGTAGTGASLVSLWQNGLLGIKAQREITWKLRRSTAVQYISPAAYVA